MTKTAMAVRIPTARRGPAGTSQGTFRRDVEGLRAVAVALVVLFDAGAAGLGGGYVGADVFFVISGYLITLRLLREHGATGRISLIGFYGRRARRILPAAGLVLLAVFAASRPELTPSPLAHLWSLGVEVQFYLVWPAALVLLLMLSRRFGRPQALPFSLGCVVGGSLAWSALHAGTWSYHSPVSRAWELGAGALLALAGNERHRIPYRLAGGLSWLGLALILASALVFRPGTPFPGIAALVPVLGAVLVLAGRGEGLLGLPPMQWLGRISYPLYLWHWPVLVIAGPLPAAGRVLLVLLSGGFALTTYVLVEQPIKRILTGIHVAL
jgi:peptidoglycan/LPS O-acetylase OafA/YrhL